MSESKMDNWYFLLKSYHQVNHLSTNRFEAQARKAEACEGQTLFSALVRVTRRKKQRMKQEPKKASASCKLGN